MRWTKHDVAEGSTWPELNVMVLWKVVLHTGEVHHFLEEIEPRVGYPVMFWDKKIPEHGDLYWMEIPPLYEDLGDIELSPEVSERVEAATEQAERDIEARKKPDDTFNF